jgi:hypothetical protein
MEASLNLSKTRIFSPKILLTKNISSRARSRIITLLPFPKQPTLMKQQANTDRQERTTGRDQTWDPKPYSPAKNLCDSAPQLEFTLLKLHNHNLPNLSSNLNNFG